MFVIDREVCIDCDVCVTECRAGGLFGENDVLEAPSEFIALNR